VVLEPGFSVFCHNFVCHVFSAPILK
jgi:hypothetical protein